MSKHTEGHTEGPWEADCFQVRSRNGRRVAHTGLGQGEGKESEANAAFIVHACNCHYELLQALKMLEATAHDGSWVHMTSHPCTCKRCAMEAARAAIAEAERPTL